MELEIFEALTSANVSPERARNVVASIKKEINEHYALHAQQLATRGDVEQVRKEIAEVKSDLTKQMMTMQADLIKWIVGAMFAGIGAIASIVKLLH